MFKLISVTDDWGISCKIALRWMPLDLTDDKSTLVKVMAWCRQATSHYLSQCWPRPLSPYGVTRPQWVKWHCWKGWKFIVRLTRDIFGSSSARLVSSFSICFALVKNLRVLFIFHKITDGTTRFSTRHSPRVFKKIHRFSISFNILCEQGYFCL